MSISLSFIEIEGIATTIFRAQSSATADAVSAATAASVAHAAGTTPNADFGGVAALVIRSFGTCTAIAVGNFEENDIINIWFETLATPETWTESTVENEFWIPAQIDAETWTPAQGTY